MHLQTRVPKSGSQSVETFEIGGSTPEIGVLKEKEAPKSWEHKSSGSAKKWEHKRNSSTKKRKCKRKQNFLEIFDREQYSF